MFTSQAADRRDRLIYVLSQINAARGDDMQVDEESSDDSEEEVRAHTTLMLINRSLTHTTLRVKNSTRLVH